MTNRVMLILIFNVLICCLAMGFVLSLILLALDVSLYVVLYLADRRPRQRADMIRLVGLPRSVYR